MTATNTSKPAKDGTGTAFNLEAAAESVSGNIAQKTYLGSPSTEGLVEPPTKADVAAITTALGAPAQQTGSTVGIVAGSAIIGKTGIDQTTPGTTNAVVVTGTVPLPAGAATAANQTAANTSLAAIDAGIPTALGQTTMTASMPVVIASNQSAVPVSAASLPLPAGAALETGNLASLLAAATGPIPAGAALIGKVGIDQTTPGTTNAVVVTGAVPLPTGASNAVAQGSTTSGQTGPLMQVATAQFPQAPLNATTNPLSGDVMGQLRVANGGASIEVNPAVTSNGAYTSGQEIGGLITFSQNAPTGTLLSIGITSKSAIASATFKAYIFNTNPTLTTWTDKTTPVINVGDLNKLLGYLTFANGDSGLGTMTIWSANNIGIQLSQTTFYIVLVCSSPVTLTSSATNDIAIRVTVKY
ncbi:MAG: hypothetical protein ACREC0_04760 [Methylocella sp.]